MVQPGGGGGDGAPVGCRVVGARDGDNVAPEGERVIPEAVGDEVVGDTVGAPVVGDEVVGAEEGEGVGGGGCMMITPPLSRIPSSSHKPPTQAPALLSWGPGHPSIYCRHSPVGCTPPAESVHVRQLSVGGL